MNSSSFAPNYLSAVKSIYAIANSGGITTSNSASKVEKMWQDFINPSSSGLQTAPPYLSQASISSTAFAPLNVSPGPAAAASLALSTAWFNWYTALLWSVSPPAPPFSVIFSVTSSPSGMATAKAALQAGLTALFSSFPTTAPGDAPFLQIGASLGDLFYTANKAGVLVSGLSLGIPVPLVVPQAPAL